MSTRFVIFFPFLITVIINAILKVSAEVMAPGSKKPLLKVDGEWNGKMMAKWATGKNEVSFK